MVSGPTPQGKTESPLKHKLAEDLNDAIRKGDTARRSIIRLLMSSISYAEMAKSEHLYDAAVNKGNANISREEITKQATLDDAEIFVVIGKEIKKHHESIDMFKQGNRPELVKQEEAELAVLETYMPKQMGRDEIVAEVRRVIAEVGAKGMTDKGKVMPKVMAMLKGKAEGRLINEVVTELLS